MSERTTPDSTTLSRKPVKGIDVVVMKNPGISAARTVTTDSDGNFKFPVLEAGSYSLRVSRSVNVAVNSDDTTRKTDIAMNAIRNMSARETSLSIADIKICSLTILGAEGGTKTEDWNLETNRTIVKSQGAHPTKTSLGDERIHVVSDGKTPLTGSVDTFILKSKSNISSN